jgi:hypothetical protein
MIHDHVSCVRLACLREMVMTLPMRVVCRAVIHWQKTTLTYQPPSCLLACLAPCRFGNQSICWSHAPHSCVVLFSSLPLMESNAPASKGTRRICPRPAWHRCSHRRLDGVLYFSMAVTVAWVPRLQASDNPCSPVRKTSLADTNRWVLHPRVVEDVAVRDYHSAFYKDGICDYFLSENGRK